MSSHSPPSSCVAPLDGAAAASPVLRAALLARIHELNFDYLELVSKTQPGRARFPEATFTAIRELSAEARRRLAAAPYTLFRLHLERTCLWSGPGDSGGLSTGQRYATSDDVHAAFCHAALWHAWHVASTTRVALRLTYGLSDETAKRLMAAPLWRLRRIAYDHPEVLAPRWPTNPAFWPPLAALAQAGEGVRLRTAMLLGHQLIAGELAQMQPSRPDAALLRKLRPPER